MQGDAAGATMGTVAPVAFWGRMGNDTTDGSPYAGVHLDRRAGAGAMTRQEDWVAETEHDGPNDGRSETRTTLYYRESDTESAHLRSRERHQLHRDPDDRRSWERLASQNDGVGDSDRRQMNMKADIRRWTEIFGSQLECSPSQRDRVAQLIIETDLNVAGSLSVEKMILAAISVVVDREQDPDDDWTVDDWIIYSDTFESMMEDFGMSRDELWRSRRIVNEMISSDT